MDVIKVGVCKQGDGNTVVTALWLWLCAGSEQTDFHDDTARDISMDITSGACLDWSWWVMCYGRWMTYLLEYCCSRGVRFALRRTLGGRKRSAAREVVRWSTGLESDGPGVFGGGFDDARVRVRVRGSGVVVVDGDGGCGGC